MLGKQASDLVWSCAKFNPWLLLDIGPCQIYTRYQVAARAFMLLSGRKRTVCLLPRLVAPAIVSTLLCGNAKGCRFLLIHHLPITLSTLTKQKAGATVHGSSRQEGVSPF